MLYDVVSEIKQLIKCNFVFHCIILMKLHTFVKHGKKPRHAQELDSGLYIFQIILLKTS